MNGVIQAIIFIVVLILLVKQYKMKREPITGILILMLLVLGITKVGLAYVSNQLIKFVWVGFICICCGISFYWIQKHE